MLNPSKMTADPREEKQNDAIFLGADSGIRENIALNIGGEQENPAPTANIALNMMKQGGRD